MTLPGKAQMTMPGDSKFLDNNGVAHKVISMVVQKNVRGVDQCVVSCDCGAISASGASFIIAYSTHLSTVGIDLPIFDM